MRHEEVQNHRVRLERSAKSLRSEHSLRQREAPATEIRIFASEKQTSSGFLRVPILGPIIKDSTDRRVHVVTRIHEGSSQPPVLVYLEQHGLKKAPGARTGEELAQLSRLASRIGAKDNAATRLPVEGILDGKRAGPSAPSGMIPAGASPADVRALMSLSLALSGRAIEDILNADPERLKAAFENARQGFDGGLGAVLTGAASAVIRTQVQRGLAGSFEGLRDDLGKVRAAATAERRAEGLARLFGGGGRGGLGYDGLFEVLLQLVEPADVSGDFVVSVERPDGKDLRGRWRLNGGIDSLPEIKEAAGLRARFAAPPATSD
ncbi:MAG: hypothetical protein HY553_11280 [Elusimicrobia bacterium]|nr:hypothetical protein [Elusimicrobiota bacterium]